MIFLKFITISYLVAIVFCKGVQKNAALTESMGQEVIEIGNPIKELPPGMEEEPSAENDEEFKMTSTTVQLATKRLDTKTLTTETRRKQKGGDQVDAVNEEARIEKELAEIYRDNAGNDYSAEVPSDKLKGLYKPIERTGFKFQPDLNNKAEVERFRTSIDEISCDKGLTQKLDLFATTTIEPASASTYLINMGLIVFLVCIIVIS